MKRISIFTLAAFILLPNISSGHSYCTSSQFYVRYSPYAFSYEYPSGLICGMLEYSPYAFSYNNPSGLVRSDLSYSPYAFSIENPSGLVPDYYRYSPYAFTYDHPSGLVSDCGLCYYWPYFYSRRKPGLVDCITHCYPNACSYKPAVKPPAKYLGPKLEFNISDGKEIICSYFKSNNINSFEIDRILKIDNKTVSINFVFRDKNIIIKYCNPKEIQSVMKQTGYKRTIYEQYEQQWRDFCKEHKNKGWTIYQIESANKDEILNKLSLYHELIKG